MCKLDETDDTEGDTYNHMKKKFSKHLPRNPLTLQLYFELEKNDSGQPEIDIARDFAKSHENADPATLIRGVQRFRARLRGV